MSWPSTSCLGILSRGVVILATQSTDLSEWPSDKACTVVGHATLAELDGNAKNSLSPTILFQRKSSGLSDGGHRARHFHLLCRAQGKPSATLKLHPTKLRPPIPLMPPLRQNQIFCKRPLLARSGHPAQRRCRHRGQGCLTRMRVDRPSALWRCGYKRRRHRATQSALRSVSDQSVIAGQDLMIAASTATIPRRSTPLGFDAALSRAATEASARACARSESAASEAVTSWAGSARKPSRARVLSLPGSP